MSADAELQQLVAAICDGVATPDERDRLQARLAADPRALEHYVAYLDLHAQLQWRSRGGAALDEESIPTAGVGRTARWRKALLRPTPFSLTMAALVMGLLVTALALVSPPIYKAVSRSGSAVEFDTVAEVSRTHSAVWNPPRNANDGTQLLAVGDEVELVSGLAEIQFHRGVRVTLEGPARLSIAGDNAATLDRGKLVAKVAEAAHGFEVRTPLAIARDLGTEFAVSVEQGGVADLHVFQGKIEVTRPQASGAAASEKFVVGVGQRLQVPRSGSASASASGDAGLRFVRRVPPQGSELRISAEYVQAIRDAGPAIYWRCENLADDRVANEMSPDHALAVVGGVRFLPSVEDNSSAVFGGTRQKHYLICRDVDMLAGPQYSVELWCQPYTKSLSAMVMLGLARGELTDSLMLSLEKNVPSAEAGRVRYLHRSPPGNTGGGSLFCAEPSAVGQWQHVAAVYDRGAMRLFVNGRFTEATAAQPLSADARVLLLGRLHTDDAGPRPLVGRLDEIAIYDRALSAAEIRQHYELAGRAP